MGLMQMLFRSRMEIWVVWVIWVDHLMSTISYYCKVSNWFKKRYKMVQICWIWSYFTNGFPPAPFGSVASVAAVSCHLVLMSWCCDMATAQILWLGNRSDYLQKKSIRSQIKAPFLHGTGCLYQGNWENCSFGMRWLKNWSEPGWPAPRIAPGTKQLQKQEITQSSSKIFKVQILMEKCSWEANSLNKQFGSSGWVWVSTATQL